jgi:hypothetical protein
MNVSEDIEGCMLSTLQFQYFQWENSDIQCDFWGTLFSDKPKILSCTCVLGVTLRVMLFRLHVGVFSQP